MWTIQPSTNTIVEVEVELNSYLSIYSGPTETVDGYNYGTLDPDFEERPGLWLKTREYIRRPRENFDDEPRAKYYYKWLTDNVPEIFFYDISGQQLATAGSYSYTELNLLRLWDGGIIDGNMRRFFMLLLKTQSPNFMVIEANIR